MRVKLAVRDAEGVESEVYGEGADYASALDAADGLVDGRRVLAIRVAD